LNWLTYALITLVFWGLWGFILKISYKYLNWVEAYFFSVLASFTLALIIFTIFKIRDPNWRINSYIYIPLIAGLCGSLGGLFFNKALEKGEASLVIPLTALYPTITIILASIFLNERIGIHQIIGIFLAIIAIILISIE